MNIEEVETRKVGRFGWMPTTYPENVKALDSRYGILNPEHFQRRVFDPGTGKLSEVVDRDKRKNGGHYTIIPIEDLHEGFNAINCGKREDGSDFWLEIEYQPKKTFDGLRNLLKQDEEEEIFMRFSDGDMPQAFAEVYNDFFSSESGDACRDLLSFSQGIKWLESAEDGPISPEDILRKNSRVVEFISSLADPNSDSGNTSQGEEIRRVSSSIFKGIIPSENIAKLIQQSVFVSGKENYTVDGIYYGAKQKEQMSLLEENKHNIFKEVTATLGDLSTLVKTVCPRLEHGLDYAFLEAVVNNSAVEMPASVTTTLVILELLYRQSGEKGVNKFIKRLLGDSLKSDKLRTGLVDALNRSNIVTGGDLVAHDEEFIVGSQIMTLLEDEV
jgi:hypothetical protein